MLHINTILFPTDLSATASQALYLARSLARDHGARLMLFSAATPPMPVPEFYVPMGEMVGQVEELKRQIAGLAASIHDATVDWHVTEGEPGPAIVTYSEDIHANLIVMATHGRSGLSRLLLGSVTEYVMRHSHCPVLTVKPGEAERVSVEVAMAAQCDASFDLQHEY